MQSALSFAATNTKIYLAFCVILCYFIPLLSTFDSFYLTICYQCYQNFVICISFYFTSFYSPVFFVFICYHYSQLSFTFFCYIPFSATVSTRISHFVFEYFNICHCCYLNFTTFLLLCLFHMLMFILKMHQRPLLFSVSATVASNFGY